MLHRYTRHRTMCNKRNYLNRGTFPISIRKINPQFRIRARKSKSAANNPRNCHEISINTEMKRNVSLDRRVTRNNVSNYFLATRYSRFSSRRIITVVFHPRNIHTYIHRLAIEKYFNGVGRPENETAYIIHSTLFRWHEDRNIAEGEISCWRCD